MLEIRCKPLSSASTIAECTYNDGWISCEAPVPPQTTAKISCRNSYRQDATVLGLQRDSVRCNSRGEWEPEPINCIPGWLVINIFANGTVVKYENNQKYGYNSVSNTITVLRNRIIINTDIQFPNDDQIDRRISKRAFF